MPKVTKGSCTIYTKDPNTANAAVLIAHGGQPSDGCKIGKIREGLVLQYYFPDGEFKKMSIKDIINVVERHQLPLITRDVAGRPPFIEICKNGGVWDYEFEPFEFVDPRPSAPAPDAFWGGALWPIVLPTKETRLSEVLAVLEQLPEAQKWKTLHCFHCRVSVETMKSWHKQASIIS